MPSWKKVISSGSALSVLNITASNLSNTFEQAILIYDTASGAVTYWTSSLEPPSNNVSQSGTVRYDNPAQTPMTNTTVRLLDESGTQITSVITNATGDFNFGPVPIGNYYIRFQTNKPWGGVSAADALNIARHFSNTQLLTGIRKLAADVNANDTITNTDALQANQRFGFLRSSFTAGDWVFGSGSGENFRGWFMNGQTSPSNWAVSSIGIPLTASADNTNLQYRALSVGDVNGSYTPPTYL